MAFKLIVTLLIPFFIVPSVSGHNITDLLSQFPDFSSLNSLLSQTNLSSEINARNTITVLAAGNKAVSAVSGQPAYVLKRILALHVILGYYDNKKLAEITNKAVMVSTLFQAAGRTTGQNGFLNLTNSGGNLIAVSSAQPGATYDAHIVRVVASQPKISVLEISSLVVPPAIGANYSLAPGPAPGGGPGPGNAPVPAPGSSGSRNPPVTARRVVAWAALAVAVSLVVL